MKVRCLLALKWTDKPWVTQGWSTDMNQEYLYWIEKGTLGHWNLFQAAELIEQKLFKTSTKYYSLWCWSIVYIFFARYKLNVQICYIAQAVHPVTISSPLLQPCAYLSMSLPHKDVIYACVRSQFNVIDDKAEVTTKWGPKHSLILRELCSSCMTCLW